MHVNPDRLIQARKQHRCDLCGLRIRKGAQHILRTGVDGREHWRMRMHLVCRDATNEWDEEDWECGWDEYDFRRHELQLRQTTVPNFVATILGG
jgi:hypothetical protein